MQWWEIVLSMEAAASFLTAGMNGIWLIHLAMSARTRAGRVAASVLALVCAGLALEALLFVAMAPRPASSAALMATLLVRTVLLASMTAIAALLLRSAWARR